MRDAQAGCNDAVRVRGELVAKRRSRRRLMTPWIFGVAVAGLLGTWFVAVACGQDAAKNESTSAPVPREIDPAVVRKVKKATAYLRVIGKDGRESQGSGFFALEPGMVFTNAHVLGMLETSAAPPATVEVIVNSGEAGEFKRAATVLGVDREADLAVVKLQGGLDGLPAPLPVTTSEGLTELQKVYVFGFPFGKSLGKNITVGESSISSIRREAGGAVAQVQVNGSMNPGNSGGPVVDARGVVIGVSVAAVLGTQIGFAVPGEKVLGLANGRVHDVRLGHAYTEKGQVKLPVRVSCLDPLQRVRTLEVEVWTGPAGKPRPPSSTTPTPLSGDGPRKAVVLKYEGGKGAEDLILPTLPLKAGQTVWVQPVIADQAGVKKWSSALAYERSDSPPLERVAAHVGAKFTPAERTLKMTGKSALLATRGREKITETDDMTVDVLEVFTPSSTGAGIRLALGEGKFFEEFDGKKVARNPAAYAAIRNSVHGFECGPDGALKSFGFVNFNFRTDFKKTEDANDMVGFFLSSYQFSSLPFPNRTLKPADSWDANIRVLIGRGKKKTPLDVVLKCTYEGMRTTKGKQEALTSLEGEIKVVKTDSPSMRKPTDRVTGLAVFDVESGLITNLDIALHDEREFSGAMVSRTFSIGLTRSLGNTLGIVMPAEKRPAVVGKPAPGPNGAEPPAKVATEVVLGGGFGREPYKDVAPEGGVLTGLEVGLGKFGNIPVIHSMRAVFRKGDVESFGPQHGTNLADVVRLTAKPGYAVGAITLKTGANVDGMSVTFMRLKAGKLDPADAYESDFVGDVRPGGRRMLTGNGRLVIGIAGLQNKQNNTGLGLVYGP